MSLMLRSADPEPANQSAEPTDNPVAKVPTTAEFPNTTDNTASKPAYKTTIASRAVASTSANPAIVANAAPVADYAVARPAIVANTNHHDRALANRGNKGRAYRQQEIE